MSALFGLGCLLAAVAAARLLARWLVNVLFAVKKRHKLCGGNGCLRCGDGRVYRSAFAGWLYRRRK